MITPKNLIFSTFSIIISSIFITRFPVSIFWQFSDNLFSINQKDILCSLILTCSYSVFKFLCLKKRFVSSAKIMKIAAFEELMISFMYTMNSRGPRIDPWGTRILFVSNMSYYQRWIRIEIC